MISFFTTAKTKATNVETKVEPYTFKKSKINPDVLKQDKFWYDAKGKLYKVEEMSKWHANGAMNKLFYAFGHEATRTPIYRALRTQAQ